MIAKAKNYGKIVKTSVSLFPVGCLWGWPGRREHTYKGPPSVVTYHVKQVLLKERQ